MALNFLSKSDFVSPFYVLLITFLKLSLIFVSKFVFSYYLAPSGLDKLNYKTAKKTVNKVNTDEDIDNEEVEEINNKEYTVNSIPKDSTITEL